MLSHPYAFAFAFVALVGLGWIVCACVLARRADDASEIALAGWRAQQHRRMSGYVYPVEPQTAIAHTQKIWDDYRMGVISWDEHNELLNNLRESLGLERIDFKDPSGEGAHYGGRTEGWGR